MAHGHIQILLHRFHPSSNLTTTRTITCPKGTQPDASTSANLYLDLYGESGQLSDLFLRDTGDLFNQGQEDNFFFPNPGLGSIGSAVISHDDSGERTELCVCLTLCKPPISNLRLHEIKYFVDVHW